MPIAGISRRALVGCACCATLAASLGHGPHAWAAGDTRTDLSPDEALELLKKGNSDFVNDVPFEPISDSDRRLEISRQQAPFAVLVGCSDSRGWILERRATG